MHKPTLACAAGLLLLAACGDRSPATTQAPMRVASAVATRAAAPATPASSDRAATSGPNADRLPPPAVPPVVRDGVRYAQAPDGRAAGVPQVGGVLVASDAATGKRLWALAVYHAGIDPKMEADAQWVFFRSMAFDGDGRLRIVDEAGRAFLVDVQQHTVSPAP
jgi:hypothetical protein